jgi:L-xylulose reductase
MLNIRFDGKRALVTGAGKGIGREIVKVLAGCGAEVVALSRTAADLDSLKEETGCHCLIADIGDAKIAQQAAADAGAIDLLVNNAGIDCRQPAGSTGYQPGRRAEHDRARCGWRDC